MDVHIKSDDMKNYLLVADSSTVEYICHMGDDLLVANCARVSFSRWNEVFTPGDELGTDERLIKRLSRDGHWGPFAHPHVTMRVTAPIFGARQLAKHQVGGAWSEISRRYVDYEPGVWQPMVWRERPDKSIKQGSGEALPSTTDQQAMVIYDAAIQHALRAYEELLAANVAPEQARSVLPLAMETQWIWTGSLAFWARVYNLRADHHAQKEVQNIAGMIGCIMQPLFPICWRELTLKS